MDDSSEKRPRAACSRESAGSAPAVSRAVSDLTLEKLILKEGASGNW
jgi:hypothetical protein